MFFLGGGGGGGGIFRYVHVEVDIEVTCCANVHGKCMFGFYSPTPHKNNAWNEYKYLTLCNLVKQGPHSPFIPLDQVND